MAYRKFYNFLLKCQSLTDSRNWKLINSSDMLCTLILKLPMSFGDRWNRRVHFTRKNQLREPDLADLIKFVDEETELPNDPLYSREMVDKHTKSKERERKSFSKRDRRFKTLAIQLEEDSKEPCQEYKRPCNLCWEQPYQEYKGRCNLCYVWFGTVQGISNQILQMREASIYRARNRVLDVWNQYRNPMRQETVINVELAKFATKNIPRHCMDLSWKRKINQGAVNDTSDQSGTSKDEVLKSNVTICDENITCASTKSAPKWSVCVWCLS